MSKIKKFSKWIHQKNTLALKLISIILFVSFMTIVLPGVSETTKEITGTNASPDTSFLYTSHVFRRPPLHRPSRAGPTGVAEVARTQPPGHRYLQVH